MWNGVRVLTVAQHDPLAVLQHQQAF